MVTVKAFYLLAGSTFLIALAVALLNWGLDTLREDVKATRRSQVKK